ncbi:unnamed protein product [Ectocarpus sp. 8 AP-2014]
MVSKEIIEHPMTFAMLNKIRSKRLSYLGALVQKWENTAVEGLSFTEWILNDNFVETTKVLCNSGFDNMQAAKKDIAAVQEELAEAKR